MICKKGQIGLAQLPTIFILLAIVGIVATIGLVIMNDTKSEYITGTATCNASSGVLTGCGAAYNATVESEKGLTNSSNRLGLVGTVIGFAVVLTVIGLLKMRG